MPTLAIQAGIMVGTAVASSLLAPKPKLQAVDRGKLDDIRITVMEEGAFKPLVYGGRVRLGGVIRWGAETQEYVTRTPGRSGGKGGGSRQAEPPTNSFTYRKSFAVLVCGNRIRRYRRIWEDIEVVFNDDGADSFADFYEAELAALSGAAIVSDGTDYSGGRAVSLSTGGSVTFEGVRAAAAGSNLLTIFYKKSSSGSVTLLVNGVGSSVTLPSTGGVVGVVTVTRTLGRGGNEVAFFNSGLSPVVIDRIHVRAPSAPTPDTRPVVTHVVDEGSPYPDDPDDPAPFYNAAISYDGNGTATGTLAGGGQAPFEFYTGTETQLQSPTIVAAEGAANVPAWRGESMVVFDDYLVRSERGQLGNFTFEVEPYIQDLADIVEDLYRQDDRLGEEEVDFSLLAGAVVEGFVIHTREQLSNWITQLQVWYNFDVLPLGGKVVAVPRGQAPSFTLTEADLYARRETDETPKGAIKRTIEDPADAPQSVDVLYLDSSEKKDFHTAGEQAQASIGDAFDRDTLTFAIVSDGDTAVAVGRRFLDQKELEQKPFEFATGPKFRHLSPADVGQIVLPDVTHTIRITGKSAELQGLINFKAVPERASLYNQTFPSQLSQGREIPVDAFPANTLLAVADCVALRQEDMTRLVVYGAGCPRGRGAWPGFTLNKKGQAEEVERLGSLQKAATMGVVETASQGNSAGGYESARSFVVKLYYDGGGIESRPLDDLRADRLNLALYGSGSRWEVIQFVSAVPQAPTYPFAAEYLVTAVFGGLYGTEVFAGAHEDGDAFILFDEAVQAFEVRAADVGQPVTFVGQTFGQAYADAEVASSVEVTFTGASRLPLAVARVETDPDTGLAPRDSAGSILVAPWPRTNAELVGDEYDLECLEDDGTSLYPPFHVSFKEGLATPALLISHRAAAPSKYDSLDKNTLDVTSATAVTVRAVSLQVIRQAENYVEAALTATGTAVARLGVLAAGEDWRAAEPSHSIAVVAGLGAAVNVNTPEGSTTVASYTSGTELRVRIEVTGREVRFYVSEVGTGKPPVYVSPAAPNYPLRAYARSVVSASGGGARVRQAMMTTNPLPTTVISADMQQQLYGSLKEPMRVRIRQHSGVRELGYGFPFEREI